MRETPSNLTPDISAVKSGSRECKNDEVKSNDFKEAKINDFEESKEVKKEFVRQRVKSNDSNRSRNKSNRPQTETTTKLDYTHNLPPPTQLIQTFSFFKWEINIDTLVRMFIIA